MRTTSTAARQGWSLEKLQAPGITVELWDQIPSAVRATPRRMR
jgi:hypothetical protein